LARLRETVTSVLSHIEIRVSRPEELATPQPSTPMRETRQDPALVGVEAGAPPSGPSGSPVAALARAAPALRGPAAMGAASAAAQPRVPESSFGKVPRNAPCPCGSGKKFKQCHGKV
jgi:preprotein translocase subunit SecA